jgi:PAS domain S-box-containing protein
VRALVAPLQWIARLLASRRSVGLALACILVFGSSSFAALSLYNWRNAEDWVGHTQQVLRAMSDARGLIQRADIAERNYRATGEARFLAAWRAAASAELTKLDAVRSQIAGSPDQTMRLDAVVQKARAFLARLESDAAAARTPVETRADPTDLTWRWNALDQLRDGLSEIRSDEQDLLRKHVERAHQHAVIAQSVLAVSVLAAMVLVALTVRLLRSDVVASNQATVEKAKELAAANAALIQSFSQLKSREELVTNLIEAVPAGLAILDLDMRYLAVSQRFRDDHQLGGQLLIGRIHYEVFPEIPAHWRAVHRRCLAGATECCDMEALRRNDGTIDWVRWEVRPWRDAAGVISGITLFTEVVTARKLAEDALMIRERHLRQAQKLEVVGQLTGGIAHDFNNLLGVIIGNAEYLLDCASLDPDQCGVAKEILNTAAFGAELTRRLLAYARLQPLQPQPVDLNEVVSDLAPMLTRTLGETIRTTTRLISPCWLALADRSLVSDALLNLTINARDAMPNGGHLVIEVANARLDAESAAAHPGLTPGDYVMLSVADSGTGMSAEVIERATEPFFTTKDVGKGSGLGLSMVDGFARQSDGHLRFESRQGVGTTMYLYLPRAVESVAVQVAEGAPRGEVSGGCESILLVDDNALMRNTTRRQLAAMGYQVITADTGPAALEVINTGVRIDLLFTDVVMPEGMSGFDLAVAARRIRPDLRVLYTTGFAEEGLPVDVGQVRMLRKPFVRAQLAEGVRDALDAAA